MSRASTIFRLKFSLSTAVFIRILPGYIDSTVSDPVSLNESKEVPKYGVRGKTLFWVIEVRTNGYGRGENGNVRQIFGTTARNEKTGRRTESSSRSNIGCDAQCSGSRYRRKVRRRYTHWYPRDKIPRADETSTFCIVPIRKISSFD